MGYSFRRSLESTSTSTVTTGTPSPLSSSPPSSLPSLPSSNSSLSSSIKPIDLTLIKPKQRREKRRAAAASTSKRRQSLKALSTPQRVSTSFPPFTLPPPLSISLCSDCRRSWDKQLDRSSHLQFLWSTSRFCELITYESRYRVYEGVPGGSFVRIRTPVLISTTTTTTTVAFPTRPQ